MPKHQDQWKRTSSFYMDGRDRDYTTFLGWKNLADYPQKSQNSHYNSSRNRGHKNHPNQFHTQNNPRTFRKPLTKEEEQSKIIQQYLLIKDDLNITSPDISGNFVGLNLKFSCSQYLYPLEKIINDVEKRKLFKLCKNVVPTAQLITLKYSKKRILIVFEYSNKVNYMVNFKDIIKGNHQLRNFIDQEFIFSVYDKLYPFLNNQLYGLAKWGFYESSEKAIKTNFTSKDMMSSNSNYKIYYMHSSTEGSISFTIMNHRHDTIDFTSNFIEKNQSKYPEYYKLYIQFKKWLVQDIEDDRDWNFRGFGELDSESENQQKHQALIINPLTNKQLRHKLEIINDQIEDILKKNLEIYRERIQSLQGYQLNDEEEEQGENIRVVKSSYSQITQLKRNLTRFQELVDVERYKFKRSCKEKSVSEMFTLNKTVLRRLLIAEKQLESKLPILSHKQQIFRFLQKKNFIIIEAETGSGKSTQIPQILCQFYDSFYKNKSLPILITQPWKLATRTLAERVASQLHQKVHEFVEYQASNNSRQLNPEAKIIFKLDRLVLEQLQQDPLLEKYSALVIDQAHERTLNIDIILGKIKYIQQKRKDFKIIVTSASLDLKLFESYYSTHSLKIPGRIYEITEIFIEMPKIKDTKQKILRILTSRIINKQTGQVKQKFYGHILIFCSGIQEIMETLYFLKSKLEQNFYKILPLHSRLTPAEQKQAFRETTKIKIILATNLAETSITINGIKTVIDTGVDRELIYDYQNKVYNMVEKKISASSAKQRAGRAGRTSDGFCFRLYSEEYKDSMKQNKIPEISNIALDTLVLRLKALNIQKINQFPFLTNPGKDALECSIKSMKMIGCFDSSENLTLVGKYLSKIPIEPIIGKAIIQSIFYENAIRSLKKKMSDQNKQEKQKLSMDLDQFEKLFNHSLSQQIIRIISMIINSTNLFLIKQHEEENYLKKQFKNSTKTEGGDFTFLQDIYKQFIQLLSKGKQKDLKEWIEKNYLSIDALCEVKDTVSEIKVILKKLNISSSDFKSEQIEYENKLTKFKSAQDCLMACLVSSFLPNLSLYSGNPQIGYTLISQFIPIQLSQTSILSIHGIYPKWILTYNLYPNQYNQIICRVAHTVNFEFLKLTVPKNILSEYKILQAQHKNPFYETITSILPTRVYLQFKTAYKNRNNFFQFSFMKRYNGLFKDQKNEIELFFLSSQKKQEEFDLELDRFLKKIENRFKEPLIYEYAGTIQAQLGSGLYIKDIKSGVSSYVIRVLGLNPEILDQVRLVLQPYNCKITQRQNRLRIEISDINERNKIKNVLQGLKKRQQQSLQFREQLIDNRSKIPKYRLTVSFYTGTVEIGDSKIFLNYHRKSDEYFKQTTKKNYAYLIEAKVKMIKQKKDQLMRTITIKKSQTDTGINLYIRTKQGNFNQFQIEQLFRTYQAKNILSPKFQFPWKFMVFRQPSSSVSQFPPKYWEDKIKKLMTDINVPLNAYTVQVKGWRHKTQRQKYTDFTAIIETFDSHYLQKFKEKYSRNRMTGLGIERINIRFQLIQNVAIVRNNVFLALKQEYLSLISSMKHRFPTLLFEVTNPILIKNTYKVFIKIKGNFSDRKIISQPLTKLKSLFKPFSMKIQPKYQFLFEKKYTFKNCSIIDQLQSKYNFKVYFIFDKIFGMLFVYAPQKLENQIRQKLFISMNELQLTSQLISYKGKPLAELVEIIQQEQKFIQQSNLKKTKVCIYEVQYLTRSIILTGDPDTFEKIKIKIQELAGLSIQECVICCSNLQQPYKLINCGHEFCTNCLTQFIKQQSLSNSAQIGCPRQCGIDINAYDISHILSEQEFNRICDLRIANFVEKSSSHHGCFTPDCPQIFIVDIHNKKQFFNCQLCGIEYCYKCKNSHQGQKCFQMQEMLQKFNIKKCPKCGEGIMKNGGCNHIECLKCGCHICWVCLETFTSGHNCYGHLLKVHGKISDENMRQIQEIEAVHQRRRIW